MWWYLFQGLNADTLLKERRGLFEVGDSVAALGGSLADGVISTGLAAGEEAEESAAESAAAAEEAAAAAEEAAAEAADAAQEAVDALL